MDMTLLVTLQEIAQRGRPSDAQTLMRRALVIMESDDLPAQKFVRLARAFKDAGDDDQIAVLDWILDTTVGADAEQPQATKS